MSIDLGPPDTKAWATSESPASGLTLTITKNILSNPTTLIERTIVSTLEPAPFAE